MDIKQISENLIKLAGGVDNISSITHCSTRLRFFVIDKSIVDTESIKKTEAVLGVVFKTDELQMVFGKNIIPFYNEAVRIYNEAGGGKGGAAKAAPQAKGKMSANDVVNTVIGFVSAAVTPLIPGLVAGGMLKVFLLLATLAYAPFAHSMAYTLLGQLANIPFYFMPIFVAYGAAKKLGATPLYAMAVAGALLYPKFIALFAKGPVTIFDLPVTKVSYSSTLFPALLIAIFAYYCEKLLTKIIPGILRTVFVGMLTMGITFVAGIVFLGPFGDIIGSKLVHVFLWASATCGPVAIGLLAACMPWLVMTGMHHAVTPLMVQAFANPGYDVFFRPSYILHNMAEGGACLGVALRTKSKEFRAECLSLAFGCIVAGITEPALYGVNFRLKRPMLGIMAGGAAGGIVAGLMNVCAYVYGYSTILALPIFQKTMVGMAVAIAVDILVAAAVTFILGFEDVVPADKTEEPQAAVVASKTAKSESTTTEATTPKAAEFESTTTEVTTTKTTESENTANQTEALQAEPKVVAVPVEGKVIPMNEIPDDIFSAGVLGNGVGIQPQLEEVRAPFDGTVESVTESKHAVGLSSEDGVELLIHVGIDTVKMEGEGFELLVNEGDKIEKGQLLLKFNKAKIAKAGFNDTVAVLVTNADDYPNFVVNKTGEMKFGEALLTLS